MDHDCGPVQQQQDLSFPQGFPCLLSWDPSTKSTKQGHLPSHTETQEHISVRVDKDITKGLGSIFLVCNFRGLAHLLVVIKWQQKLQTSPPHPAVQSQRRGTFTSNYVHLKLLLKYYINKSAKINTQLSYFSVASTR